MCYDMHMPESFSRFEMLIGKEALLALKHKKVIIFGVGGVGGYALEGLVRSGVGHIDIVDMDDVAESNLNRQIIATRDSIGKAKVDVAKARALSINPDAVITIHKHFYLPDDRGDIDLSQFDYVIDAIDTVKAKLDIISECARLGVPLISSMGCGNRMDPSKLRYADLYKTKNDPLSKVMRKECKKLGIKRLPVVYSEELPKKSAAPEENGRHIPASSAFVPSAAGLFIASKVVRELIDFKEDE